MYSRIAPFGNTRPTHQDERAYLNTLAAAIKVAFYGIENGGWRPLSLEMLHEWDTTYRTPLALCSEWLVSRNELVETSKHEDELVFVDGLIAKIRQGFAESNPVAHITLSDIEALERAYRSLDKCKTRLVYY